MVCSPRPKQPPVAPSVAGFTVLENLTLVFLIGILSAIAVPAWNSLITTQRLESGIDRVYWSIQTARSNAKRDKIEWQVSFRETTSGFVQWAVHPTSLNHNSAQWHSLDAAIRIDPETTYPLLKIGIRRIEFGFLGEVKTIPFGRITLSSKSGGKAKRCLFVSTLLGTTRIAKEQPKPKEGKYCY